VEIYIKERKNNMAYTQRFGLSRNSPLSNFIVEEEKNPATSLVSGINEEKQKVNDMLSNAVGLGKIQARKKAERDEAEGAAYAKRQSKKSWWNKTLDGVQDVASVAGLFPAYGAAVDIPNAILSGIRTTTNAIGDTAKGLTTGNFDYSNTKEHALNTALNTTAILPVAGQAATSGRLGTKALKLANAAKYSAKGAKVVKYGGKAVDGVATAVGKFGGTKSGVNIASQGIDALANKDGNVALPPAAKSVGLTGLTGKLTAKMASFFN